ncbi:MAG TPA: class I lanthipeptide [Mycobacteriales bacterium]|nr:class I lanthipeptide [Mycobacteriales bacterium]
MKRSLSLKRETLAELTVEQLTHVAGAAAPATGRGTTCPLQNCLTLETCATQTCCTASASC